jgi:hypothetical protein
LSKVLASSKGKFLKCVLWLSVCLFARHNSKNAEHICMKFDVGEVTKRTVRWQHGRFM